MLKLSDILASTRFGSSFIGVKEAGITLPPSYIENKYYTGYVQSFELLNYLNGLSELELLLIGILPEDE